MSLLAERTAERTAKELPYVVKDGTTSDVPRGGIVGRGVNRKSGDPFLIYQDGRTQQAIPLGAVAQAIYAGTISREEIAELHKAADADAKKAEKAGA